MTDLLTRLAAARPTPTELDAMWSPEDRDTRFATLGRARRSRGRRAPLLAAAAAAALLVVPPVLDSGDATAADLHALAEAAVRYDGPVLAEGTWLHERSTTIQRNSAVLRDGRTLDTERETWTGWDGTLYLVEHRPSAGWTSYDVLDERFRPSVTFPTPAFAAGLPDDAAGLRAYLDPRVQGSSSHDEALFEALRGLITSHTLPPVTLAAAFEALAGVDRVSTDDTTVDGRAAVEIRYDEPLSTSSETLTIDRVTGQVLTQRSQSLVSDFRSTTTTADVVAEVPADVLAAFAEHGDGSIACDADRPGCALP